MRRTKNSGAKTAQIGGGSRFGDICRAGCFDRGHDEFLHLASERLRQFRIEMEVILNDFGLENSAASINEREMAAVGEGHAELQVDERINRQGRVYLREQIFEARPRRCGNEYCLFAMAIGVDHCRQIACEKQVCFIQDVQAWAILHAEIGEHLHHFGVLLGVMRIGNIGDVKNERGFLDFFECGAESGDQVRGKIAEKSHGIGKQGPAARWQANGADGGIESSEHLR